MLLVSSENRYLSLFRDGFLTLGGCVPSEGEIFRSRGYVPKKYSRYVERERRSKMADIRSPPMLIFLISSATVNKSLGIAESGVLCASEYTPVVVPPN